MKKNLKQMGKLSTDKGSSATLQYLHYKMMFTYDLGTIFIALGRKYGLEKYSHYG